VEGSETLYVVGVTGASGSVYARRLLEELKRAGHDTLFLISDEAKNVIKDEGEDVGRLTELATRTFSEHDMTCPASSGSVHEEVGRGPSMQERAPDSSRRCILQQDLTKADWPPTCPLLQRLLRPSLGKIQVKCE
jgi:hypothetical protein